MALFIFPGSLFNVRPLKVRKDHFPYEWLWRDSFMRMTWLIHMCDTTRSYVGHVSCVRAACLIRAYGMAHSYEWHDLFICVTWLMHVCDMTPVHAWHDSSTRVTWHIHRSGMPHSYKWQDVFTTDDACHDSFGDYVHSIPPFIRVTWLTYVRDMTHSYVRHALSIQVTWLIHQKWYVTWLIWKLRAFCLPFTCVTCLIRTCEMTHSCVCMCMTYLIHTSGKTFTADDAWYMYKYFRILCAFHLPFKCVTCLVHIVYICVWQVSFMCVTWLVPICDMTDSFVGHAPFMCVTCLIYMCNITHSPQSMRDMTHFGDSAHSIPPFIFVKWLINTCDIFDSCVRHASFICATCLIHTCDMTHSYV